MSLANKISIGRVVLVPFFVAAILYQNFNAALLIFIVCVLSDGLDGYIARRMGQDTKLGALLDPIADKLLILSSFISISLGKGISSTLSMPLYVPLIIISRDVLILIGCVVIYLIKGRIDIKPTRLGKTTTFFQMITVLSLLSRFAYSSLLWNTAVIFTVLSGLDYLRIGSRMLNEE